MQLFEAVLMKSLSLQSVLQNIFGIGLLIIIVIILYPYCQYYIDPDAVAYLQLTKNYSNLDYYNGMSSLWNPLHAILAGFLSRMADMPIYSSLLWTNVFASIITIITCNILFNKYINNDWCRWIHNVFLGIFWGINAYFQLTSDVFGVLGLNFYVLILLQNKKLNNWRWNLLLGLVLAFSCLAKTYSFYIEVLLLVIWLGYLLYSKQSNFKNTIGRISTIGITALVALLPWVIAFYYKYGVWNVSLAGKYNMSSRVSGTSNYKQDIHCLIPPSHNGALTFWEDPHWLQGEYIGIFDNTNTMFRYILRLGYNVIEWTSSISHLSIFFGAIWLLAIYRIFNFNNWKSFQPKHLILYMHIALFPLGLWMVHVEPRYMWYCITPAMILGILFFQHLEINKRNLLLRNICSVLFIFSFFVGPIHDLKNTINVGKSEFELSQKIKSLGLQKGSYFANLDFSTGRYKELMRLTHFLDQPLYLIDVDKCSMDEKLIEAKRYGIDYYYHFLLDPNVDMPENFKGLDELTKGRIEGLRIYDLKNTDNN